METTNTQPAANVKPVSSQKVIAAMKKAGFHTVAYGAMSHAAGYTVTKNPHDGTVRVYWMPATIERMGWDARRANQVVWHDKAVRALTAAGIVAAEEDEVNPLTGAPTGLREVHCRGIRA